MATMSNSKSQKGGNKRRRSTLKGIDAANLQLQFDTTSPQVKDAHPTTFKPMKNIIERVHEEEEEDFDEGAGAGAGARSSVELEASNSMNNV
jgi:hypothetical protein